MHSYAVFQHSPAFLKEPADRRMARLPAGFAIPCYFRWKIQKIMTKNSRRRPQFLPETRRFRLNSRGPQPLYFLKTRLK
jgi:hypothetical protein